MKTRRYKHHEAAAETPSRSHWPLISCAVTLKYRHSQRSVTKMVISWNAIKPHLAIMTTQLIFGTGTILVGSTLVSHPMDPVIFAFIRERFDSFSLFSA